MGQDLAHVEQEATQESPAPFGMLLEPVFWGLLADWGRYVPRGIIATWITGAAVSGCTPGIGWPIRSSS